MNILASTIKNQFIKDQAGFQKGCFCSGQALNLIQYINKCYETSLLTEIALIDLSATCQPVSLSYCQSLQIPHEPGLDGSKWLYDKNFGKEKVLSWDERQEKQAKTSKKQTPTEVSTISSSF